MQLITPGFTCLKQLEGNGLRFQIVQLSCKVNIPFRKPKPSHLQAGYCFKAADLNRQKMDLQDPTAAVNLPSFALYFE